MRIGTRTLLALIAVIQAALSYRSAGFDPRAYGLVYLYASILITYTQPAQPTASDNRWRRFLVNVIAAALIFAPLAYASWLGAGLLVGGVLATAAVAAIHAMDHFGVLGSARQPMTLLRAIGAVLMIVGFTFVFFPEKMSL